MHLFILSSGVECNALSHICGRLHLPMILFRVGLFTLIYVASFMALTIL